MAGIKVITPPSTEPVTKTEVETQLRLTAGSEDTYLDTLIAASREDCESFQNRAYITQTWELTLDAWPFFPIKLPMPPLISVTSIKYFDTDDTEYILAASNYFVDTDSEPGRVDLAHNISLPTTPLRPINGVKIRYIAGYGAAASDVPRATRQAILMLIGHYYENREATSDKKMEELPMAVASLLWKNRLVPI